MIEFGTGKTSLFFLPLKDQARASSCSHIQMLDQSSPTADQESEIAEPIGEHQDLAVVPPFDLQMARF
jgi:hypothetical protein